MISAMNLGKITKCRHKSLVATAKKYTDKAGRTRYQGTRSLKSTQFPSFKLMMEVFICLFRLFPL